MNQSLGPSTPDVPETEFYYQWKELVQTASGTRLLNVQRDPHRFSVGDLNFNSVQEADKALDDFSCREEAIEDKWILVKTTYEPVPLVELRILAGEDRLEPPSLEKQPVDFIGTVEECEQYATDDDYKWKSSKDKVQCPLGGFYYRLSDPEHGVAASALTPMPRSHEEVEGEIQS